MPTPVIITSSINNPGGEDIFRALHGEGDERVIRFSIEAQQRLEMSVDQVTKDFQSEDSGLTILGRRVSDDDQVRVYFDPVLRMGSVQYLGC
ncbi:MAG: hypothetical protein QG607_517 [Patescibacteria group bacterium]|nr:hypothetical protein [Patescibacteria group bacterium]